MELRDKMNRFSFKYFLLPVLYLSGCAVSNTSHYNEYYPDQFRNADLPSQANLPETAYISAQTQQWWEVFQDPALDAIVERVLTSSFDVRSAIADVERAEAIVRGAKAGLMPSLSFNGESNSAGVIGQGSSIGTTGGISLDASWNVDLFGAVRKTVSATQARQWQSEEIKRDVQRLVVARTVQSYIGYRSTQERAALTRRNINRLTQNTQRVSRLVDGGYNTKLDLRRSENQIFEQKANLAALEQDETSSINALALLVADSPATLKQFLGEQGQTLELPSQIPVPQIDILTRHRSDIRSAQYELLATTYGEHAARAQLYPSLSSSLQVFSNFKGQSGWPELGSLSGALINSIAGPLLGRGRLLASVDERQAETASALVDYERTVLSAVLEIDDGLSRWTRTNERLGYRQAGLESAVESQQLAERLFYAGELDFTSVVVAEQSRLQAEDNYLLARNEALASYVSYVAAVIPGW